MLSKALNLLFAPGEMDEIWLALTCSMSEVDVKIKSIFRRFSSKTASMAALAAMALVGSVAGVWRWGIASSLFEPRRDRVGVAIF